MKQNLIVARFPEMPNKAFDDYTSPYGKIFNYHIFSDSKEIKLLEIDLSQIFLGELIYQIAGGELYIE